ncbi:MAG: metallophosphoesterase [Desulfovibrionaceae bacterium]
MYWIAFGDIHESTDMLERIPGLEEARGVILTGDLTNRGGRAEAACVLNAVARRNPRILAQVGNMDTAAVHAYLCEQDANLHLNVVDLFPDPELPKICAFGVGFSTPTPFGTPNEVSDSQIGQWVRQVHARTRGFDELVAVIHTPPLNTRTDRIASGAHVGSAEVRAFLEEAQPALCLTGHIHESMGEDQIGRTRIINPGILAQGGYVRIERENGGVTARLEQV